MSAVTLTVAQLKEAASLAEEIENLQTRLNGILNGDQVERRTRRPMSPKARKAIGDAQRARWAKAHAVGTNTQTAPKVSEAVSEVVAA